jgi:hypothetical protein
VAANQGCHTVPVRVPAVLATLAALVAAVGFLPAPAAAADPSDVCVISDPRAMELSGLVATPAGYVTVNDSNLDASKIRIFYLDQSCKITKAVPYPTAARDPEDLAVGPDGTLWVADTGDSATDSAHRTSIALWRVPADGGPPVINRLTYPDGPHNAAALLFAGDGTPVVITKETTGRSGLYVPTGALQPNATTGVPLKKVGEFAPQASGMENSFGLIGEVLVTGAATAPDRHRIVLRTYTAAYEWDVVGGDVVKAITTTTPRLTPLPDEAQGESIAYTADGSAFLTVSDRVDGPVTIRRITPSKNLLTTPTPTPAPAEVARTGSTLLSEVPLWASISAGAVGLLLVALGFIGVRRARRGDAARPTPSS